MAHGPCSVGTIMAEAVTEFTTKVMTPHTHRPLHHLVGPCVRQLWKDTIHSVPIPSIYRYPVWEFAGSLFASIVSQWRCSDA